MHDRDYTGRWFKNNPVSKIRVVLALKMEKYFKLTTPKGTGDVDTPSPLQNFRLSTLGANAPTRCRNHGVHQ